MKLNKAGLAFKELRFSPSTKDADITNAAIEIWKIENLAVDMYEMLENIIECGEDAQSEIHHSDLIHSLHDDIKQLLKRARGE